MGICIYGTPNIVLIVSDAIAAAKFALGVQSCSAEEWGSQERRKDEAPCIWLVTGRSGWQDPDNSAYECV